MRCSSVQCICLARWQAAESRSSTLATRLLANLSLSLLAVVRFCLRFCLYASVCASVCYASACTLLPVRFCLRLFLCASVCAFALRKQHCQRLHAPGKPVTLTAGRGAPLSAHFCLYASVCASVCTLLSALVSVRLFLCAPVCPPGERARTHVQPRPHSVQISAVRTADFVQISATGTAA